MNDEIKEVIMDSIKNFRLPRYHEIPNVGLYLEQTSKYITDYLQPLGEINVTGSMISNYVKKKLIANPVKKMYGREQIAYLIFISVAKTVLSMENIRVLFDIQKKTYEPERAYDYFCSEFEESLRYVFGAQKELSAITDKNFDEKLLVRRTINTSAYKIYLDKCFEVMAQENKAGD